MAKKLTLSDIQNDPNNLNLGNGKTGQALIEKSVEEGGWGRSMLMSADGVMIAGNHALEAARKRGEEPIIVDSDGSRPIIVRRTDIKGDDDKATFLGLMDNQTNKVNLRFDMARVEETIAALDMDPSDFAFAEDDFRVTGQAAAASSDGEKGSDDEGDDDGEDDKDDSAGVAGSDGQSVKKYQVIVIVQNVAEQQAVFEQMTNDGYECRVTSLDI